MSEHTHTYTHEHSHTYTHDHEGGDVEHTHENPEHDHDATHNHQHTELASKEQVIALLDYNWKHNLSHGEELKKLSDRIKSLGDEAAAGKVSEAADFFSKGNAALEEALKMLKNS